MSARLTREQARAVLAALLRGSGELGGLISAEGGGVEFRRGALDGPPPLADRAVAPREEAQWLERANKALALVTDRYTLHWDDAAQCLFARARVPRDDAPLSVLRTGRKVGRTLYRQLGPEPSDDDPLVGVMDTRELADLVVAAFGVRQGTVSRIKLAARSGEGDDA